MYTVKVKAENSFTRWLMDANGQKACEIILYVGLGLVLIGLMLAVSNIKKIKTRMAGFVMIFIAFILILCGDWGSRYMPSYIRQTIKAQFLPLSGLHVKIPNGRNLDRDCILYIKHPDNDSMQKGLQQNTAVIARGKYDAKKHVIIFKATDSGQGYISANNYVKQHHWLINNVILGSTGKHLIMQHSPQGRGRDIYCYRNGYWKQITLKEYQKLNMEE